MNISSRLLILPMCLTFALAPAQVIAQATDSERLQEQPPPWSARPNTDRAVKPLPTQAEDASDVSGVEDWYRNRQNHLSQLSSKAQQWQQQAEQGDAEAQYQLGLRYQGGVGVERNATRAQAWLQKAAEAGHAKAQYALALLLRQQANQADGAMALRWQEKAAQQGNREAQYGLGLMYANGQYVQADTQRARFWFGEAADRGHLAAKLALANMPAQTEAPQPELAQTTPPPSQPEPATQSTQQIATAPAPPAAPTKPAPPSQAEPDMSNFSAEELEKAAYGGDRYAQLMLGVMYEDGVGGVPRNLEQAAKWYLKSARQGYAKAQHNLALLYEDGRGLPQSYEQAAIWYAKAAQQSFAEAQNNLAVLYLLGEGVSENRTKAERLLRLAVEQGNPNARRNLQMLLDGAN